MDSSEEEPRRRSHWEFGAVSRARGLLQRLSDRREDRIDCRNHVLQCAEITPSFCPPAFATPQCLVGYEAASIDFLGPSEEGSLLPEEVPGPSTHSYSPNDLMNLIPTPNNQRSSPSPAQHRERALPLMHGQCHHPPWTAWMLQGE